MKTSELGLVGIDNNCVLKLRKLAGATSKHICGTTRHESICRVSSLSIMNLLAEPASGSTQHPKVICVLLALNTALRYPKTTALRL